MCVCVCVYTPTCLVCGGELQLSKARPGKNIDTVLQCLAFARHKHKIKRGVEFKPDIELFFKSACVHGQKEKPDKNLQIFNFRYKLHTFHHLHGGALNKAVNFGHSLKLGTFTFFWELPSPGAAEKATFCYQIWFLDNSTLSNEQALMPIEMDTDLAIAKQNLDLAKTSVCTFCVIWESFSMIL